MNISDQQRQWAVRAAHWARSVVAVLGVSLAASGAGVARAQSGPGPASPEAGSAARALLPPSKRSAPAPPPPVPNIDYGARVQAGLVLNGLKSPDGLTQTTNADLYMKGQVVSAFKWMVSATSSLGGRPNSPSTVDFRVLDAIARFEPAPWFNVWMGRMLVVVDRFGQAGPWGVDEWFLHGLISGAPLATPRTGPLGRDLGVNIWGAPFGGHLKYYAGVYQLQDPDVNPLFSGRLQLNLVKPEGFFFHRNTYYGGRELATLGVGAQYQRGGSRQPTPALPPDDFAPIVDEHELIMGDLAVEKHLGPGTLSANAAAYRFRGAFRAWDSVYMGSLGYTFRRKVGLGNVRPSVRVQELQSAVDGAEASRVVDAQLSYVMMKWYARVHLSYRKTRIDLGSGPAEGDTLVFGVVLWDP